MNYSDEKLQDHELNFWIDSYAPPFFHYEFYNSFFNFNELKLKKTLDVGCGGAPISDYCGVEEINLTILDPLINKLIENKKYQHLKKYNHYSVSIFDFNEINYEYIVCLNVIDHFNDPEYNVIDKFHSLLNEDGYLWLYYDLRSENSDDHLKINNDLLFDKLNKLFDIIKVDNSINPKHRNWSNVTSSIRLIGKKK